MPPSVGYLWPISGRKPGEGITNPFGAAQVRSAGYKGNLPPRNNGLDIGAPAGTPVVAPAGGKVLEAGWSNDGYGFTTLIQDGAGNKHRLSHLQAAPRVKPGQTVEAGLTIGAVGMTGNATGPHLDYEYITPQGHADPLKLRFGDASMAGDGPGGWRGSSGAPGGPPPPPPKKDEDKDKTTKQKILDAINSIDVAIKNTEPGSTSAIVDFQKARATLLDRLLEAEAADAEAGKAKVVNVGGVLYEYDPATRKAVPLTDAKGTEGGRSVEVANIGAETSRRGQDLSADTSRYGADVSAETARYGTNVQAGTATRGQDIQKQIADASLKWQQDQFEINKAFEERKITLEEAKASLAEAHQKAGIQLQTFSAALQQQGNDISVRGQDLSAQTSQRNTDVSAGTASRGQDMEAQGRLLQAGTAQRGQDLQFQSALTGQSMALSASQLPFMAPIGTSQDISRLLGGANPNDVGGRSMPVPFDPQTMGIRIAQDIAAKFQSGAPGIIQQGMVPTSPYQLPPQIQLPGAPQQIQLPQIDLSKQFIGRGGGFVAPVFAR